ncbi:MAG TPA: Ig-like domain-containing protein, partial [Xanthomonadales bacterium]|nr:Ig-like domain-containing protein [Xanthomonadales bacterium]
MAQLLLMAGSALVCAAHAAEPLRLDQLVLRNGAVATALPPAEASGLALDALGRAGVGQSRYSVWAITNREAATKSVRLESIDGTFTLALSVAPDTRVVVRSPVVRGQATHRLVADGAVVTARDGTSTAFADATPLVAATTANRAPVILSAAPTIAEKAPDLAYAPIALDADHDPVTFAVAAPADGFAFDAANGVFRYRAGSGAASALAIVASDERAGETRQTLALRSVADFCPILPLTVADALVANATVGQRFDQLPRATGSGNYSFLTWTGANDAPALAASLTLPGDSDRYVDPDDATDHQLDAADFAQGAPGSMNASAVRAALDALLGRDVTLPLFDATRGQGSRFDYRIARFATFRLHDYRLTGQGYLSLEYRGTANCYNDAPTALPQSLTMPQDTVLALTVLGTDPENDALAYHIVDAPGHGMLTGTAPNLTYTPAIGYVGADRFTFVVSDGEYDSAPAAVDID